MTKKAAVINDLSGFGKCSLTAAIPVLSALGIQCCPMPTAVLTGQTGYPYYHCTDLTDMMPKYTDAWLQNDVSFDAIYSGYMTGRAQIGHLLDFLSVFHKRDTLLLVDPVMGDDGRVYGMYSEELLDGMKTLSRKADLITPNLTEACLLADMDFQRAALFPSPKELLAFAEEAAQKLRFLSGTDQDVVITGIKFPDSRNPRIYNLALCTDGTHVGTSSFFQKSYSGTGDLFASIICGCRLNGMSTAEAMNLAGTFLYHCIEDTIQEDIPGNDGIHFEKHLIELIQGGTTYGTND